VGNGSIASPRFTGRAGVFGRRDAKRPVSVTGLSCEAQDKPLPKGECRRPELSTNPSCVGTIRRPNHR
jgi:hypothetical protein